MLSSLKKPEFDSQLDFLVLALGPQPFPDPLPSTDVARGVGNNSCFPLSQAKVLFPFQRRNRDNLTTWEDAVLPVHRERQQTAEGEFSFRGGNLLFQQDRNRPVHKRIPRPSGSHPGSHNRPGHFQPIQCSTKHPVRRTSNPDELPQHLAK